MPMRAPSLASSKDPASYPFFRGEITRAIWRVYTQRLTPAGRWFVLISAILIGYGGSSLQIQAYVIAGYLISIWAVAALFVLIRPAVQLDVVVPRRARAGDKTLIRAMLTQRSRFRGNDLVLVPHRLPLTIDALPENGVPIPNLRRGERATESFHLLFKQRGVFTLKGFRVESSFPFGLLQAKRHFRRADTVLVHPTFTPLESLSIGHMALLDPGSFNASWTASESMEFLGNREYRTGDRFRDIDWRATARMQQTIVREWIQERQARLLVYLEPDVDGIASADREATFERAVSLTAAAIEYLHRSGFFVQLRVGDDIDLLIAPSNPADLDRAMDHLASVTSRTNRTVETAPASIIPPSADLAICFTPLFDEAAGARISRVVGVGTPRKIVSMNTNASDSKDYGLRSNAEIVSITESEFEIGITRL